MECIACLSGVAKAPLGCPKAKLREVFNNALPLLSFCLEGYNGEDDVIQAFLSLLRDYAEHQLVSLPPLSSLTLYRASLGLLSLVSSRLKNSVSSTAEEV